MTRKESRKINLKKQAESMLAKGYVNVNGTWKPKRVVEAVKFRKGR